MGEVKGKRPELTGEVKRGSKVVGKIAAWVQEDNLGGKRPVLNGNVDVDGVKVYFVAWLHGWHLVKDA